MYQSIEGMQQKETGLEELPEWEEVEVRGLN